VGSKSIQELTLEPKESLPNPNKAVNFYNRSVIGGYYGGDRIQLNNRMNLRLGDKFIAALNVNYNRLNLVNGTIDAFVSGTRLTYSFSPKMFLQSLIQYNKFDLL